MTKRSYNQTCSTAYALDVIGERWTLLIIREMLPGARRYTDLLNALPGIGTNLLANRLKDLEANGVIAQRKLPPPASSTVYELTPLGKQLEEPFKALSVWGMNFAPVPPPDDATFPIGSAIMAMRTVFSPQAATGITLSVELHVDEDVFHAVIDDGKATIEYGPAENPDVVAQIAHKETILLVLNHIVAPDEILESGLFTIEAGDGQALMTFWNLFRLDEFIDLNPS